MLISSLRVHFQSIAQGFSYVTPVISSRTAYTTLGNLVAHGHTRLQEGRGAPSSLMQAKFSLKSMGSLPEEGLQGSPMKVYL